MKLKDFFIQTVINLRKYSTCYKYKVAAILVKDNRIISIGYNGTPSNYFHCEDTYNYLTQVYKTKNVNYSDSKFFSKYGLVENYDEFLKNMEEDSLKLDFDSFIKKYNIIHSKLEVHAEENCIINAVKNSISIDDSVLFSTHLPCFNCVKLIFISGIKSVYYIYDYIDSFWKERSLNFLKGLNIKVEQINVIGENYESRNYR